jgi:hypothetical protein
MITVQDILKNTNAYIGDSSTDRVTSVDRYQAATEAVAWLLEELGNEHMVDRADIDYLPTVTWYKMDTLTPYLLTAGNLRFKNEKGDRVDFTRVEPRDLASMPANRHAYAIERYNDVSYMGIKVPTTADSTKNEGASTDLILLNSKDSFTYTGINAENIVKEADAVRFDMTDTVPTATGLSTVTGSIDLTNYEGVGYLIFEIEIPDMTDVNSVSLKFGDDLSTDYWLGTVTQDVNSNPLVEGVNTIAIKWSDLTVVGTPTVNSVTRWSWTINHDTGKPLMEAIRVSDMRVSKKVPLTFKYIFYRVGKNTGGTDLIEFTADTDVPFFAERYPQYRFAVAHKTAAVLFRNQRLLEEARAEERDAREALGRYRKNFAGERDMSNSAFKVAGINLRGRRIIKRR